MGNKKMEGLVRKWAPLLEGFSTDNEVANMATLLQNTEEYYDGILSETGSTSYPEPANIGDNTTGAPATVPTGLARYKKIAIPLTRRVFPELLANQLVGVQPMSGPVGLAYALRFRDQANNELGFNVPTNESGTQGDRTALPGLSGEVMNEPVGRFGSNGAIKMREVGLTVEQKEVSARTRKLKASWTVESAQDLAAMQNIDLEQEMMDLLAYEVSAEIDRELVGRIHTAAEAGGQMTWNYGTSAAWAGGTATGSADGRWEAEKFKTLWSAILNGAEDIARTTRMGSGNYVICSPKVCVALQQLPGFQTSPVQGNVNSLSTGVSFLGTMGGLKIYRDTFAYQHAGLVNAPAEDFAVIGYKGARENDTGIIYCPYIPVMFSKATGEESFSPRAGVMTRYGVVDHLFGSQNYYRKINVKNLQATGSLGTFS